MPLLDGITTSSAPYVHESRPGSGSPYMPPSSVLTTFLSMKIAQPSHRLVEEESFFC